MKKRITSTLLLGLFGVTSVFAELSYDVLDNLQINGVTVDGFNVLFLEYDVNTPYPEVPEVTATTENPNATIDIEPAASLPGTTTIEMRDGTIPINFYEIHFTTATEKLLENDLTHEEIGAVPADLTVSGNGITVAEAPNQSGEKSVFIDKSSSPGSSTIEAAFPEQAGTVVVEGKFLFPEEAASLRFLALGNEGTVSADSGNAAAIVLEARNGAISYKTGDDTYEPVLETYDENEWHHIKVVADVASATADIFVNHNRVLEGVDFLNGAEAIDRFAASSSEDAGYHLTDLIIYKVVD